MGQNQVKDAERRKEIMRYDHKNEVLNNMIKRVQQNMEKNEETQNKENKNYQNLPQTKRTNNSDSNSNKEMSKQKQNNFNSTCKQSDIFQVPSMDSGFNSDICLNNQMNQLNNQQQQQSQNFMTNRQKFEQQWKNQNNASNDSNIPVAQPNPKMSGQQQLQKNLQNSNNQNYKFKKLPHINCDFQQQLFALPKNVISIILKFLISEYKTLSLLSASFYYKVHEVLEEELLEVDNKFIQKYIDILSFRDSFLSYTPIKISKQKGFRLDRNIIAEVLPTISNKCVTIAYTYKTYGSNSHQISSAHHNGNSNNGAQQQQGSKQGRYFCQFKFDIVDEKIRNIWVYKEECKHNFDEKKLAFIQPIIPIMHNDCIKLSVNFYNLNGLIDLDSIQWKSPKISEIQKVPLQIDPNDVQTYDKNRICEIEEIYTDWTLYEYYHKAEKIKLDHFKPGLNLQEVRCAGVDIITSKHIFKAEKIGFVEGSMQAFGVHVKIVPKNKQIVSEIKKIGLFHDLENTIELRVGDYLIVYISKGD